MKTLDYIALALVVVGAVNWGLIGFFDFDLVRMIFGDMTFVSRVVYALVGIAGLYSLSFFGRVRND
ncbi:MAG: putative rane protein [Herbinix sp.]|nr:putative rane protein [Herbinix sp.]